MWNIKSVWLWRFFFHYYYENDKVEEVVKRVNVLNDVHDISPTLQRDYKKDGHPCKSNVVKTDSSLKRVCWTSCTDGVKLKGKRLSFMHTKIWKKFCLIPVNTTLFIGSLFWRKVAILANKYNIMDRTIVVIVEQGETLSKPFLEE